MVVLLKTNEMMSKMFHVGGSRLAFILMLLEFWGCKSNSKTEVVITSERISNFNEIRENIDQLIYRKKFETVKPILDSLINIDSKVGYLYFQRGLCYMEAYEPELAIKDFNKSDTFGFNKKSCTLMRHFSDVMIWQRDKPVE